jgi:phage shock protein PspC (stress-responsive transcriptional regulator)
MKQVININFHGQVVPIEVSAFDLLKSYTDSLNRFFSNEEGKEEIINDIESRIAELFQERLKKGATCITDDDVSAIIKSMGTPDDFELDEEKVNRAENNNNSSTGAAAAPVSRRLTRDAKNQVFGGVCSGIANYFNIDPLIVRIIFVVVAMAFGTGILAYIIMWVAVPSSTSGEIGAPRRKLYRDPDDKIIAGVGGGLGSYFGINPWIPRAIFLLPFLSFVFRWNNFGFGDFPDFVNFSFSPGAFFAYIILWLVLPEASSTTEKLQMKGEKVDMNSIKNSVMEEMKGVQKRAEKIGEQAKVVATEAGELAREKATVMGSELKTVAYKRSRNLGDVLLILLKAFAYFIIGCVVFALVMALIGFAIFAIGVFPFKDYLLTEGWQNALAWGTLIFFIAVPVIGIVTWIIRRLAKIKGQRTLLRASFISMWILGWICAVCLIASITQDFRSGSKFNEQQVALTNPSVNKLIVTNHTPDSKFISKKWLRFEPFEGLHEDSAMVNNVEIKIVKSTNDSFRVTKMYLARGKYSRYADSLAAKINFNVSQSDSALLLDKGISINKIDKLRNQKVIVIVYVPVGKQIRVEKGFGYGNRVHFGDNWDDNFYDMDLDEENDWENDVDYVMRADGLYTLGGIPANEWRNYRKGKKYKIGKDGIEIREGDKKIMIDENGIEIDDNYRYDNNKTDSKLDSLKLKIQLEEQKLKDSLRKEKEKIDRQLEKINGEGTAAIQPASADSVVMITPLAWMM